MQPLHTHHTPGRTATVAGRPLLFFSGFSYLGLHAHPAFLEALKTGIDRYGAVFVSSRIANLRLSLYEELEHALAVLQHQQAAVVFSSGYLAAQAAVQYARTKGQLLYAPNAHPALHTGVVELPALPWNHWAQQTVDKVNAHPDNTFVIVGDAVNPLTAAINDYSWLSGIQRRVRVLIDDSHGIGILGPDGSGIAHHLPQHAPVHYLLSASLAKAYSMQGGVVSGHAADIAAIKKQPVFTAGTPPMPANAYAFLQSFPLHAAQRGLLQQRVAQFSELTANMPGIRNPFQLPVFLLENAAGIEQHLLEHDIIISSFGYPNPDSPPVNRIVLSALHTAYDLEVLHKFLAQHSPRSRR